MNPLLGFSYGLFWARAPLQQTLYASKSSTHGRIVQEYPILRRQKWKEDEIQIVDSAMSNGKSWKDCIDLLPRRTPGAIEVFWRYRRNAAELKPTSKDPDVQAFLDVAAKGLSRDEIYRRFPYLTLLYQFTFESSRFQARRDVDEG